MSFEVACLREIDVSPTQYAERLTSIVEGWLAAVLRAQRSLVKNADLERLLRVVISYAMPLQCHAGHPEMNA